MCALRISLNVHKVVDGIGFELDDLPFNGKRTVIIGDVGSKTGIFSVLEGGKVRQQVYLNAEREPHSVSVYDGKIREAKSITNLTLGDKGKVEVNNGHCGFILEIQHEKLG